MSRVTAVAAERLVEVVRDYRRRLDTKGDEGFSGRKWLRLRHELWSLFSSTDIKLGARIGRNLQLPHPNGVVIHENSIIGDDCMIMQQVTIGQLAEGGVPQIGSNVYIGSGAKILGRVTIGDGAAIGANAVVLQDVPAHSTAVGIPARVVRVRNAKS